MKFRMDLEVGVIPQEVVSSRLTNTSIGLLDMHRLVIKKIS